MEIFRNRETSELPDAKWKTRETKNVAGCFWNNNFHNHFNKKHVKMWHCINGL